MSSSVLEIIELPNGEIVLQRVDDDAKPLVKIQFSEESREYFKQAADQDNSMEVAKVMIQAGIQAAAELSNDRGFTEAEIEDVTEYTLH